MTAQNFKDLVGQGTNFKPQSVQMQIIVKMVREVLREMQQIARHISMSVKTYLNCYQPGRSTLENKSQQMGKGQ